MDRPSIIRKAAVDLRVPPNLAALIPKMSSLAQGAFDPEWAIRYPNEDTDDKPDVHGARAARITCPPGPLSGASAGAPR